MAHGIALASWIAAGLLALGVLATLLIPAARPAPEETADRREAQPV